MNIPSKNVIGFKELRVNSKKYLSKVQKGESFVVMQRSKPVFKMVPVDEWGDEGTWDRIVDFREINPRGIQISEALKSLKRLRKHNA